MKKTQQKRLSLGKIKIASLSKPEQHMLQGGSPQPTAPIICDLTVFNCRSKIAICDRTTIVKMGY